MVQLVLQEIVPLLGLAIAGVVGGRYFDFRNGSEKVLTHFVLWFAGPSALILAVQSTSPVALLDARLSLTSLFVWCVCYFAVLLIHKFVLDRPLSRCAIAASCTTSMNLIMIGLPITLSIAGDEAGASVAINALLSLVIFVPVTVAFIGKSESIDQNLTFHDLSNHIFDAVRNPLVIGTLVGLLLLASQISIPGTIQSILVLLKESAVPVGMVALGLTINSLGLDSINVEVCLMSGVKMILSPAVAFAAAYCFKLPPASATSLILLFSCPPALHAYVLASENEVYEKEADGIILLSLMISIITIPGFIYVCKSIWTLP